MLFVSERSWKHHFVTLLLPYNYLSYRLWFGDLSRRGRAAVATALVLSTLFMATTSTELGGLFARHQGHKLAQGYGMFLWAGVVVYIATAWRVWVEGRQVERVLKIAHGPHLKPALAYRSRRADPVTG
jgi:hypothetical protein